MIREWQYPVLKFSVYEPIKMNVKKSANYEGHFFFFFIWATEGVYQIIGQQSYINCFMSIQCTIQLQQTKPVRIVS